MILANFAVIEGCDGSGTTTQLKLLEKYYKTQKNTNKKLPVFFPTYEPTRGHIGLLIRRILQGEIPAEKDTIARLFAADRGEHLHAPGGIIEHCRQGELVVSDRYTPSSVVYQGLECGKELTLALNSAFPHPELLFYIDLDPAVALARIEKRTGKREIYEVIEFQARVRFAYLDILPLYEQSGVRVIRLDGERQAAELTGEIWSALCKMPIMGM